MNAGLAKHARAALPFILFFLFLSIACATRILHGEEEAATAPPPPSGEERHDASAGTAAEEEPAPAPPGGIGAHTGRLMGNFMTLMRRSAGEALAFTGHLLLSCVLWSIGFLLLGLASGIGLWIWLRRRGYFDAPWGWYRYVRWLWAALFLALLPLCMAYAGLWYGGGRCAKRYVIEERVLDRIAANLICAVALDKADYALKGSETAEDYARVLSDAEGLDAAVEADFQAVVERMDEYGPSHPFKRWLLGLALNRILGEAGEWLYGVDVRALALALVQHRNLDEYMSGQGQPPTALVLFATHMKSLRRETVFFINTAVYPQVALGLSIAFGLPFLILGCFRLTVRWCGSRRARPASVSSRSAPVVPPPPAAEAPGTSADARPTDTPPTGPPESAEC